jgi:hypothetical protein
VATTTDADVQAWLERYADTWIKDSRVIAQGLLPGIGEVGVRVQIPDMRLTPENAYDRVEIMAYEFYCKWLGGLEFTTTRLPPPATPARPSRC